VQIDTIGDGYALHLEGSSIDLTRFTELTQKAQRALRQNDLAEAVSYLTEALALWNGNPLSGVHGPYIDAQRVRIIDLYIDTVETYSEAMITLGRYTTIAAELRSHVAAYPLRERLSELLMLALHRSGRQTDALTIYQAARRALWGNLKIAPGPGLQEMYRCVLHGNKLPRKAETDTLLAPPKVKLLSYLPSEIGHFTGRTQQIQMLTQALTNEQRTRVALISGMGGSGKTALAIHLSHLIIRHFPDGQFFVDLGALSGTPTDPRAVLGRLLQACCDSSAETLPESYHERAILWRSMMAARRYLIVLDDAANSGQVEQLLPALAGSAAIVTSRARMVDLHATCKVNLGRLSPEESISLFARVVGGDRVSAEPNVAEALVNACAHNPLAICIVGTRLRARPGWTMSTMENYLRSKVQADAPDGNHAIIETPFELGYFQLNARQAEAFRKPTVLSTEKFSAASAAALLGLDTEEVKGLLDGLVELNMLESLEPDSYQYDPLMKEFARRRAFLEGDRAAEHDAVATPITALAIPGTALSHHGHNLAHRSGAYLDQQGKKPRGTNDRL
jgi:hypothetical protein